jgi:hypothetical protein
MTVTLCTTFIFTPTPSTQNLIQADKQEEDHRTPLIWRPQAPDQESTVCGLLFPLLKSIIKGACFADVAEIQERVTAVLRSIPKEAFADSFQKLYERC